MKNIINVITGAVVTIATYFLGGWDIAIQSLLVFIVVDYITGVLKAIYNKELNSAVGLKGIIKKVGYLLVVSISVLLDKIAGNTGAIRNIVIYFFVANEGLSILENWGNLGLPLPKQLTEALEQLKNNNSKK
jgi:toxin secretion/phage lysis holin